ncbi:MAG: hypothetical protein VCD00_15465 [Candidatus Hydrogenedentota bacterium]
MSNRSLLVRIPAFPFTIDALRPNRFLATLAAQLLHEQWITTILDYGTVEGLERLDPQEPRTELHAVASKSTSITSLLNRWRKTAHPREHSNRQHQMWESIGREIIDRGDLGFVVFDVARRDDQDALNVIIPMIRYYRPSLPIIGVGDFFRLDESHLVEGVSLFDCIYWGDCDEGFTRFVSTLDRPDDWNEIPFLAYSDSVRMVITRECDSTACATFATPDYSRSVYPALYDETKLLLFDVEEVRINADNRAIALKSPAQLTNEVNAIMRDHGSRAFHLLGAMNDYHHAEALAYEFLARRLHIRYTRDCHIASTPTSTVTALRSSGCYGASFQIDTGSQRLLDLHYDAGFTVTEVEQTLRACLFSNLYTVMHFSYPCIEDDYHTKAETLRVIERVKPNSAPFSIPSQNHQHKSDLKRRFRAFSKTRSVSDIRHEHNDVIEEVEQCGISTRITAPIALMAELAGFRGQEEEFLEETLFQLMTGDAMGLRAMLGILNKNAAQPDGAVRFKPFSTYRDVVGN